MEDIKIRNGTVDDAFDCLKELIKLMTYGNEKSGMREASLKQLNYIKDEFSQLERDNCGLRQTNLNMKKKLDKRYVGSTPWRRQSDVEKKATHE